MLEVAWIHRSLNVTADSFSKEFDYDDWSVSNAMFRFYDRKWGAHTCDRFADNNNNKVSKFTKYRRC